MFISNIIARTKLALLSGLVCLCAAQGASAGEVKFHKIRVVYSSTSDWTALVPAEGEEDKIKSVYLFGSKDHGVPMKVDTQRYWLKINDDKSDTLLPVQGKGHVTLTDMAVDASVATTGLRFKLSKGSIGEVVVQFWGFNEKGEPLQIGNNHALRQGPGQPTTMDIVLDGPSLTAVAPQRIYPYKDFSKKALAFYYAWYWTPGQWSTAPGTTLIDYADPNTYTTSTPASLVGVIDRAIAAGLDGFIMSWWGFKAENDINENRSDVESLKQAIELSKRNFTFSIYYETARIALQNFEPAALDTRIGDDLISLINSYGGHTNFLKIGTRPVIFLFATGRVTPERWKAIFARVRQGTSGIDPFFVGSGCASDMVDAFDGMHDYGVVDKPRLDLHVKRCSTVVKNHFLLRAGPRRLWAGTASPGYDDTKWKTAEQGELKVERKGGEYFKQTLNIATANKPDWMLITSWNEYPENTHIEPSKLHGNTYQQIANEYLMRWKSSN